MTDANRTEHYQNPAQVGSILSGLKAQQAKLAASQVGQAVGLDTEQIAIPPVQHLGYNLMEEALQAYQVSERLANQFIDPVKSEMPDRIGGGLKGDIITAGRLLQAIRENMYRIQRVIGAGLIVIALVGASASAQLVVPVPGKPATHPNLACENTVEDSGFTGCELLRLESFYGKIAPLQVQMQAVNADASVFIKHVVAQSPGKQYEAPSQQFPYGRLVDIPKTQPTPVKGTPNFPQQPAAAVVATPAASTPAKK